MFKTFFLGAAAIGLSCFGHGRAEAGYVLTANPAGSQSSTAAGVTTESFDSFAPGRYTTLTTAIGTLSSPGLQIVAHDQYGGAGGSGNYFAIGAQSGNLSATLTLRGPQSYFGFWWSAADGQNQVAFYSNGTQVASFNAASAFSSLDSTYAGNPAAGGADSGEKFAYVNFTATGNSTFDQVVFTNTGTGTGFESDNWSTRAAVAVPEPSSLALTATGFLALLGVARRRRAR